MQLEAHAISHKPRSWAQDPEQLNSSPKPTVWVWALLLLYPKWPPYHCLIFSASQLDAARRLIAFHHPQYEDCTSLVDPVINIRSPNITHRLAACPHSCSA